MNSYVQNEIKMINFIQFKSKRECYGNKRRQI